MFEDMPQELKQEASKVLAEAAGAMWKTFYRAEEALAKVDEALSSWRDELDAAAKQPDAEGGGTEQMYNYLLSHSSKDKRETLVNIKGYLNSPLGADVLKALYEAVLAEDAKDDPFDFWEKTKPKSKD